MDWLQYPCILLIILPCTRPSSDNIARGKPTFQSGILDGGESSKAVDGDKNPDYQAGSCAHTDRRFTPWWAVDLQWSRLVEKVELTNRRLWGHRLAHIRIGTTDVSPNTTAPTLININICASRDYPVPNGASENFTCGAHGRFLVVMLEPWAEEVLTLCEVEVFVSTQRQILQFEATKNSRLVGHVLQTMEVDSVVECAEKCLMVAQCGSFNLRTAPTGVMTCEVNGEASLADVTSDSEYVFSQISRQE